MRRYKTDVTLLITRVQHKLTVSRYMRSPTLQAPHRPNTAELAPRPPRPTPAELTLLCMHYLYYLLTVPYRTVHTDGG